MATYKHDGAVPLIGRQGIDRTNRFRDLAIATLPYEDVILEGEVAVFDEQLVSRFEWLRGRPSNELATPPMFMAFDCLHLEGRDLRQLPLRERRAELEAVTENDHTLIFPARRLAANGLEAWAQVVERGYEGLVAKDPHIAAVGHSRGSRSGSETIGSRSVGGTRRISRARLNVPGGCRDARPSPEGDEPPSRGCPFGLYAS
jgi:ATP-dependent DNA ligase